MNLSEFYPTPGDCWFLTGPTAAGKSALALELATELNAEIVSLDSMALYRGMDIGTAKPSLAEQQQVPHHLIDVLDPHEEFSLAQYVDAAEQTVKSITARGKVPLFVGGTPLYLKALLRGIFAGPAADWELRKQLDAFADREGDAALHARLATIDPDSARRLHQRDRRRIIRALEVYEKTGTSITELQRQFERVRPLETCRVLTLEWPRDQLNQRIDARVDQMFGAGWLAEVERLRQNIPPLGRTASQAVGYREIIEHLQGNRDLPATIQLIKLRTRQFAKRQMTWFRSLSECRLIDAAWAAKCGAGTLRKCVSDNLERG